MESYGLSCESLVVSAGARKVLDGLTLRVAPGKTCAVLGESGSGKTTLLRTVGGFLSPTSGLISIDDVDVGRSSPQERPATLLFQEPRLFPALNVFENVAFALRVKGIGAKERKATALSLLSEVGLDDRAMDPVTGLSGGEQQRVALARALCIAPPVLLLDEPFSAVDAPRRQELREVVRDLLSRRSTTTVFVSHDIHDAERMADTVAVLVDGRIVQHDEVATVLNEPASPEVERLVSVAR